MGSEEAELRCSFYSIRLRLDVDEEVYATGGLSLVCDHRVVL